MRKIILIAFVALTTMSLSAQRFGVKAGLNLSNYYGEDAEELKTLTGFQVGGLFEMPLSGGLFLQPEAILSLKGATASESGMDMSMKPFYLEVPVKLSYKLNAGPGKFTIGVGPYAGLGIFGKASVGVEGYSVTQDLFTADNDEEALLKRFDFGVAGAMGYELPSGLFFNLESAMGLLNVAENAQTKNTVVSLVAGFKF